MINRYTKYGVVVLKEKVSDSKFYELCEVSAGSFAFRVANRIYNDFIRDPIEAYSEFKNFFSNEYESFKSFMQFRYNVDLQNDREDLLYMVIPSGLIFYREQINPYAEQILRKTGVLFEN